MLNEKTVNVSGVDYTIRELTIGQMLPLMEKLQGEDSTKAQMEIVSLSVCVDGNPIGDEAANLGFSTYMGLSKHVMAINGMGDEGND
jgi:hypothetical protein